MSFGVGADEEFGAQGYGNNLPAVGAHHVMVKEVEPIDLRNPDVGDKVHYKVLAGPSAGGEITEWLFSPVDEGDEKKFRNARRKMIGRAKALGLITDQQIEDAKAGR